VQCVPQISSCPPDSPHAPRGFGACGALEAIASIKMIEESILIPTRNLKEVAPDCSGVFHVRENMHRKVNTVLSNNFAFGGMNTCLLISAVNQT
jgi:3-oxoacyl-[acyl-carrier-protein] synthase II